MISSHAYVPKRWPPASAPRARKFTEQVRNAATRIANIAGSVPIISSSSDPRAANASPIASPVRPSWIAAGQPQDGPDPRHPRAPLGEAAGEQLLGGAEEDAALRRRRLTTARRARRSRRRSACVRRSRSRRRRGRRRSDRDRQQRRVPAGTRGSALGLGAPSALIGLRASQHVEVVEAELEAALADQLESGGREHAWCLVGIEAPVLLDPDRAHQASGAPRRRRSGRRASTER